MYRGNHFYQCIVLCLTNQRWSLSPRQKALTIVPSLAKKSGSKLFEQVICIKMNGTNSFTRKKNYKILACKVNTSITKHVLTTELLYYIEE
jgi:hypothetical protein